MLICFKADEATRNRLDTLVALSTYKDYSDVITAAVGNLLLLHEEMGAQRALVLEAPEPTKSKPHSPKEPTRPRPVATVVSAAPRVPEVLQQPTPSSIPHGAPIPDDAFLPTQQVPLDRWPFGQYSKLLPAKVSVRALANIELRNDSRTIEAIASYIAGEAATLTEYLAALDDRLQLQRDDALAVGFPSNAPENAEKSRLRYANQFVASVNKSGIPSGLLVDLKLVNVTNGRSPRLQLTAAGWEFALLFNPVLDASEPDGQRFTKEERTLLVNHIHSHVPAEAFAYRAILRAILDGASTPDDLDVALHAHVPAAKKDKITNAFITTQRSGVISRMADLSLVTRQRTGIRVAYKLTDDGQTFMTRHAAA